MGQKKVFALIQSMIKGNKIKKLLYKIIITGLLLNATCQAQGNFKNGSNFIKIKAPSLANSLIKEKPWQTIGVYLPPSYSSSKKNYPVIYYLNGWEDQQKDWQAYFTMTMNQLVEKKEVKEMIIVNIQGINIFGGSFYVNSPFTGNWEDFILKDVISYIDSKFRTIKNSSGRGIAGHSMGGFGAINLGFRHPEIFSSVYTLSPGFYGKDGFDNFRRQNIDRFGFWELHELIKKESKTSGLKAAFEKHLKNINWKTKFTFSYAAAFSADKNIAAPYLQFPLKNNDRTIIDPNILKKWEAGYGNVSALVKKLKNNKQKLKAIGINYGSSDMFGWIIDGTKYLSERLKEEKINHEIYDNGGGHDTKLAEQLKLKMIPFFSKNLSNN